MHLLSAQAGSIQQEGEAIDLGQSPAPLVFASAADSELALMAGAADRAGTTDLRCASILRLAHNLSVDLWLDRTVRHAKLVVVRLLGGPAYWPYGVDELTALAQKEGAKGLAWLALGADGAVRSSFAKFLEPGQVDQIVQRLQAAQGDLLLFVADRPKVANAALSRLRLELGDRLVGIMGGYIRWCGLVDDNTRAIAVTERLTGRQLDPFARDVVMTAAKLHP